MPIEEITLSVPQRLAQSLQGRQDREAKRKETAGVDKLARAYLKSARARDRFAFTDKGRMRNRERFSQSLKAIVKKVATDASSSVNDRSARMGVRTRIYADVMELAKAMSKDQLELIKRARRRLRWGLALAAVGLLGITSTLGINDIVEWPLGGW